MDVSLRETAEALPGHREKGHQMASLGSRVRRSLGRYERSAANLYRGMFVDLNDFSDCIRRWTQPRSILEIGSGEGALAEQLVRRFPHASYLGIDIIPHVGRLYQGPREKVEFREMSSQQLASERRGQFDLVILADVLHHVEDRLRLEVLQSARALMSADGCLVLKDWIRKPTPIHAASYIADVYIGGDRNVRYMSLGELRHLMTLAFGPGAIKQEASIAPWRHNHAFLVSVATEAPEHGVSTQ